MFDIKSYILETVGDCKGFTASLATSHNNIPSVVPLSFILENDILYAMTDSRFNHSIHIYDQHRVSVCTHSGIQFNGEAVILPDMKLDSLMCLRWLFMREFPASWDKYNKNKHQIFLKIKIDTVSLWRYIDDIPYRAFLDYNTDSSVIETYSIVEESKC